MVVGILHISTKKIIMELLMSCFLGKFLIIFAVGLGAVGYIIFIGYSGVLVKKKLGDHDWILILWVGLFTFIPVAIFAAIDLCK